MLVNPSKCHHSHNHSTQFSLWHFSPQLRALCSLPGTPLNWESQDWGCWAKQSCGISLGDPFAQQLIFWAQLWLGMEDYLSTLLILRELTFHGACLDYLVVGQRLAELRGGIKWELSLKSLCSPRGRSPTSLNAIEPYLVSPKSKPLVWELCIGLSNKSINWILHMWTW